MITNKDLSIDSKNGQVILNGDKYDLGTQGEIDAAVKDVYSVMGEMGAKNLIPYPYYESDHTEGGITWTVNSDGSVTANGTATENSTFIFRQRTEQTKFVAKNKSYILSGCPSGGSNSKYMMYLFVQTQEPTNITSGIDYGKGAIINMPDQDYYGIYAFARVISGQTVSDLTFKPMLRLASDTDNTYQPYAMTNKQLTDELAGKQDTLTFDKVPTENSTNPVTSGGVFDAIDGLIKKAPVNTSTSANGNILIEMLQSEKTVLGCLLTRTDTDAGIIADLYTYNVSGTLYWGAHCRDANAASAVVASTAVSGYVYYIDKPAINS